MPLYVDLPKDQEQELTSQLSYQLLPRREKFYVEAVTTISPIPTLQTPAMNRKNFYFNLCLFTIFYFPAFATDYYLSSTGNDNNAGTMSLPWKTIAKLNTRSFRAGDKILLSGGSTFFGNLTLGSDDSGSATNPITIGSFGQGRATINGGEGCCIFIYNTSGIIVKDLILSGNWDAVTQKGNTTAGLSIYIDLPNNTKLNYIKCENLEVKGFKTAGIGIGSWPTDASFSGFHDVVVNNCEVHDNGDNGISSYGYWNPASGLFSHRNIKITYCKAYNNRGITDKGNNSGSGIILSGVDGGLIERCVAYNNGELNNFSGGGPVGIWAWEATNVTIQYNESYSNNSKTLDGGGFDLDGGVSNSALQYNYSHDNKGPGYLVYQFSGARKLNNNVVRYNISENDGYGLFIGGGSDVTNNLIYNNTFFSNIGKPGFIGWGIGVGNKVYNNIFCTSGELFRINAQPTGNITMLGNNYWRLGAPFFGTYHEISYNSLSSFRAATGQEKHNGNDMGFHLDPMFNNPGNGPTLNDADLLPSLTNYSLKQGSPLIDAGMHLTNLFGIQMGPRDFNGNSIPQNKYDIGANEYLIVTSLGHNAKNLGLQIYPNPSTKGEFYIHLNQPLNSANVEIFDSRGLLIANHLVVVSNEELAISTSGWKKGLYLIKVLNGNNSTTQILMVE